MYVSKDDSDHILRADRPADVFRNSIATPSLLAAIINAKYGQALPLDRQSKAFKQEGINLETNTLSNWVINSSDTYLSLIYNRMKQLMSDSKVIHADETPVDVMRMDGSNSGNKTYMWVYRNRPLRTSPPMVLFDWQPSRKPEHPREFLKDFNGTIVTDGYQVYHKLEKERDNLKVAGCWIHARRKYAELIKSEGKAISNDSIASKAYNMITSIMHEDNKYDDLPKKDRERNRKLTLKPMVNDYFAWIKEKYPLVAPQSALGKALFYSINQEQYLRLFLKDGDIPMDNNYALYTGYFYPHLSSMIA